MQMLKCLSFSSKKYGIDKKEQSYYGVGYGIISLFFVINIPYQWENLLR